MATLHLTGPYWDQEGNIYHLDESGNIVHLIGRVGPGVQAQQDRFNELEIVKTYLSQVVITNISAEQSRIQQQLALGHNTVLPAQAVDQSDNDQTS